MYNHEPKDYNCPFCAYIADPDMAYRVYQDEKIYAFISSAMWPKNQGIVIIIPRIHVENIYEMPDDLLAAIHIFAKRVAVAMKQSYKCDGVSTRQHNEPAGNQEVFHYHFQVVPRYIGDDLYLNHKSKSDIPDKDRLKYAQTMKDALKNAK